MSSCSISYDCVNQRIRLACSMCTEISEEFVKKKFPEEFLRGTIGSVFRNGWIPYPSEYWVLYCSRDHPFSANSGTVPARGTTAFSPIKMKQTLGSSVLWNDPGTLIWKRPDVLRSVFFNATWSLFLPQSTSVSLFFQTCRFSVYLNKLSLRHPASALPRPDEGRLSFYMRSH